MAVATLLGSMGEEVELGLTGALSCGDLIDVASNICGIFVVNRPSSRLAAFPFARSGDLGRRSRRLELLHVVVKTVRVPLDDFLLPVYR